jgi:glycosyltransferase involved in cell wall biosynthesis
MTIVIVHPHQAFLPEIEAYIHFFTQYNIRVETAYPHQSGKIKADVEWHFMGTHRAARKDQRLIIHEYASASVPPFRRLKDRIKSIANSLPDYRLFLNEYVMEQFRFSRQTPYGFRDMGISSGLIVQDSPGLPEKRYDFIYSGAVTRDRQINKLLDAFCKAPLNSHSLLILSRDYSNLADRYAHCHNITFTGPIPTENVPEFLRRSKFCINYRPGIEPHSHQTSTKLLEYAACRISTLTSDGIWIRDFCKETGARFFFLADDLSNLTWENINKWTYVFPDLSDWTWESQIRKSGVLEFIQSRLPQLRF